MKNIKLVLCVMIIGLFACGETPQRPDAILDENYQPTPIQGVAPASTTPPPATPGTPEPAQNETGVWHYTCTNGCAGGGGSATPCATCGTALVRNQLYHAAAGAGAATTTSPGLTATGADGAPITLPPTTPKTPEPAQNATGVWHYTCSNGCSGGGGSATACGTCGNLLAHNPVYHQ